MKSGHPANPRSDAGSAPAERASAGPEALIVMQCERANFAHATRLILRQYANEVRAFLRSRTRTRVSMEEVYSVFSEDVFRGLPRFRFQGRVRSWLYVVARNALARHSKINRRWRTRHLSAELDELAPEARRSLSARSGDLAQLEQLMGGLDAADRRLVEQRLVLSMAWRDIAIEQLRQRRTATNSEIDRESARLRKRFQLLLQQLRTRLAEQHERMSSADANPFCDASQNQQSSTLHD